MHAVPGAADEPWNRLLEEAVRVMRRAYAPYSDYQVGAAGLADDGRLVVGCNVENASYGVTLCAECGLVSHLHATGGGRLTHVVCVDRVGGVIMPCGRCRQLLSEAGGHGLLMLTRSGVRPMSDVLPDAFGPDALGAR
jgi:cytidine deaminase